MFFVVLLDFVCVDMLEVRMDGFFVEYIYFCIDIDLLIIVFVLEKKLEREFELVFGEKVMCGGLDDVFVVVLCDVKFVCFSCIVGMLLVYVDFSVGLLCGKLFNVSFLVK